MSHARILLEAGGTYHIYVHAVGNENIFRNDANYIFFLSRFSQWILPFADVLAFCLMKNHFHLLIRIKERKEINSLFTEKIEKKILSRKLKNKKTLLRHELFDEIIVDQFSHLFNSYVQAYNKMFGRKGTLFKQSFMRKRINTNEYLIKVICYIHNNPVNDGFCEKRSDWKYSSYNAILSNTQTKVLREDVLEIFGGRKNFVDLHDIYLGE